MAHLGEIAVKLHGTTPEVGVLFHQHNLLAGFRSFKRRGHAGDAAAHDQNGLVGRHNRRHVSPPSEDKKTGPDRVRGEGVNGNRKDRPAGNPNNRKFL